MPGQDRGQYRRGQPDVLRRRQHPRGTPRRGRQHHQDRIPAGLEREHGELHHHDDQPGCPDRLRRLRTGAVDHQRPRRHDHQRLQPRHRHTADQYLGHQRGIRRHHDDHVGRAGAAVADEAGGRQRQHHHRDIRPAGSADSGMAAGPVDQRGRLEGVRLQSGRAEHPHLDRDTGPARQQHLQHRVRHLRRPDAADPGAVAVPGQPGLRRHQRHRLRI